MVFHCGISGFIQQFWEKTAGQNWETIINLMSKLGKIINIKHNYGSKIYPKNQVILDCFYAKHKCLSNILIWVIDSHKLKGSVKLFFLLS